MTLCVASQREFIVVSVYFVIDSFRKHLDTLTHGTKDRRGYLHLEINTTSSPTVTHTCRKRRPKWVPSAWGYNWATLLLGDINTEAWSSKVGVGRRANNPTL
jgi:hypothetical protein